MSTDSININVPILARVEGEGALELSIENQTIKSLQLKIYEPPRLFEKFLEGRAIHELLDIVARICGICPVAYQMSATHAVENCFKIKVSPWIRAMRRVFYCGEWIESHSLHIHLLAAPDILGFASAADMAKHYPQEVHRGLRLQAFGNELISLFGKRSVHPVGACIGGFYRAPSLAQINNLLMQGEAIIKDCQTLLTWLTSLPMPHSEQNFTCVSLYHPNEYPMNEGNIVSNHGLNIAVNEFDAHFQEHQVAYSTALHCKLHSKPYLVGPLARVNNCFGHLPNEIHLLLQQLGLSFPSNNMHHSIIARAIEIYYAVLEALTILGNYTIPTRSREQFAVSAGYGYGCTEAPRGLLWQCYQLDTTEGGLIKSARIVPPTSQNQARIEEDLTLSLIEFGLHQDPEILRAYSERVIRNYDPCISCSTHFIRLHITRL